MLWYRIFVGEAIHEANDQVDLKLGVIRVEELNPIYA